MLVKNELKQGIKDTFPDASSIFGYLNNNTSDIEDWIPVCNYWSYGNSYHAASQSIPQYIRAFFNQRSDVFDFNVFEYVHEDMLTSTDYHGNATWVLVVWVEDDGLHYIEVECFDKYSE